MKTRKIAIIASRAYDEAEILNYLQNHLREQEDEEITLTTGGHNAQKAAEQAAQEKGWETSTYRPNWKQGKQAGVLRSLKMIEEATEVLCFWDGKSIGTQHELRIAREKRKPITHAGTLHPADHDEDEAGGQQLLLL